MTPSADRGVVCAVMPQKSIALKPIVWAIASGTKRVHTLCDLPALRIAVQRATGIGNGLAVVGEIVGSDRHFAVAAGNVEHVCGLGQARDAPAQGPHQALTFSDGGAEMAGTGCRIEVV